MIDLINQTLYSEELNNMYLRSFPPMVFDVKAQLLIVR